MMEKCPYEAPMAEYVFVDSQDILTESHNRTEWD